MTAPTLATNRKSKATQWAAVGFALANGGLLLLTVPLARGVTALDMQGLVPSVLLLCGVVAFFVSLPFLSAWALWGVLRKFHQSGELAIRVHNQPVSHSLFIPLCRLYWGYTWRALLIVWPLSRYLPKLLLLLQRAQDPLLEMLYIGFVGMAVAYLPAVWLLRFQYGQTKLFWS